MSIGPLFVLLAILTPPPASTVLIKKDLRELCVESEIVILARVGDSRAEWNREKTLIWTRTRLETRETWKGPALPVIEVMEPGGIVGDTGQMVQGMARYEAHTTVVVFLKKDVLGQWRTHGCCQGAFVVRSDLEADPAARVGNDQAHVLSGFFAKEKDGSVPRPTLDAFKERVLGLVPPKKEGR